MVGVRRKRHAQAYLNLYVHTYTHTHTHTHVCIHACMCVYINILVNMNIPFTFTSWKDVQRNRREHALACRFAGGDERSRLHAQVPSVGVKTGGFCGAEIRLRFQCTKVHVCKYVWRLCVVMLRSDPDFDAPRSHLLCVWERERERERERHRQTEREIEREWKNVTHARIYTHTYTHTHIHTHTHTHTITSVLLVLWPTCARKMPVLT